MSEGMNKHKRNLKKLAICSSSRARRIIQQSDDDFILAILDAVWTMLAGKVQLSPAQRKQIKNVQPVLRRFASRGQSVEELRCVLSTKKGVHAIQTVFNVLQTHF